MLLTLSFWREYRTMFYLGRDWNLHESNVSRRVRRIEDILIKSGKFSLPGKKRLLKTDSVKYTIVDVTESLIERPKKNSKLHQLSKAEKKANRELAAKRVKVEDVIRRLKIFRILGECYRHRRKRFGLRFNLIAGLHNYELKLKSSISQEVY